MIGGSPKIEKMDFHKSVKELMDQLPETSATLISTQTISSTSSSASSNTSFENSLFEDYFNRSVDSIIRDELEDYIAVDISLNVSGNNW